MDVIPSPQARLPIGTCAPALAGGWENCVRMPGPIQLLVLHLLALLHARSPHAAALCRALPLSPRLRDSLARLVEAAGQDESVLRPIRARGADEILIALAHRLPPRNPSRPARTSPARRLQARDPPEQKTLSPGGRGLDEGLQHPPISSLRQADLKHVYFITISKQSYARRTS